jgi:hypothetical protein
MIHFNFFKPSKIAFDAKCYNVVIKKFLINISNASLTESHFHFSKLFPRDKLDSTIIIPLN